MRTPVLGILLSASLLAGCATAPPMVAGAAPPPMMAVRDLLYPQTGLASLLQADRPHAFVVLTDPGATNRNREMCNAYSRLTEASAPDVRDGSVTPVTTYWPVKSAPANGSCQALLASYDHNRAAFLRQRYSLQAGRQYLLVVDQANRAVYIDLTKANPARKDEAFTKWFSVAANVAEGQVGVAITTPSIWSKIATVMCNNNVVTISDLTGFATGLVPGAAQPIAGAVVDEAGRWLCRKTVAAG